MMKCPKCGSELTEQVDQVSKEKTSYYFCSTHQKLYTTKEVYDFQKYQSRLEKVLGIQNTNMYWKNGDERFNEVSITVLGKYDCEGLSIEISYWYDYKNKYDGKLTIQGIQYPLKTVESLLKGLEQSND